MTLVTKKQQIDATMEPVRVLGRGLRAARGVRLSLRALREAAGKTQTEVASDSQMDQSDISRLESRADFGDAQMATVRRYVAALGGQLELVVAFGNKRIILTGAPVGASPAAPANKALQRTGRKAARR